MNYETVLRTQIHSRNTLSVILTMGKKKEICPKVRDQMHEMYIRGYTMTAIGIILGVSQSTVSRSIKRKKEQGHSKSRMRVGRPRASTRRADLFMKKYIKIHPHASSSEVRANLPNAGNISKRTIRRRLSKEFGLKSYKPARKPLLSEKNIKDRKAFCEKYKHWTPQQWENVMFSDESMICQFANYTNYVRRPAGMRYDPKYTIATVKNPPKVMVWGAISANGRCGLSFLPPKTIMNGQKYLEILKEKLPAFMEIKNTTIFQQDGAPCHTCKSVKSWLETEDFELLQPWPGNSPDLNPIENCWTTLKMKVSEKLPTSFAHLCEAIKEVWVKEISVDYCRKLVHSMPDRIDEVLKNKGLPTKY